MNDFLQQFLIESREFVEQATKGLLVLERSPNNAEILGEVFRAFHTLKGGAGIVEFPAMEHALHAAEDLLSDARASRHPLNAARVADCFTCLDQVAQWLDVIEQTGELPSQTARTVDTAAQHTGTQWSADLLTRHPALAATALAAVRFIPDSECFYHTEDPIARITGLPQLLAMELEPAGAPPPLNELDPYKCNLILTALTAASVADVVTHMQGCSGEYEIAPLESARQTAPPVTLPVHAAEVLAAQAALLLEVHAQDFIGRVASAGTVAANVLRFCGRREHAELIARATQQSLAENTIQPLQQALTRVLAVPDPIISTTAGLRPAETTTKTLRVDAGRIDALVRLTSELTVAKNAVGHLVKVARAQGNALIGSLKEQHDVLERLIRELQLSVLAMRVLPLRTVLRRFPRLVREMSATLGKPVRLEVEGDETEADKAIVEMLFEPLLHIVRNALDHGVEPPAQRVQRGKPAVATLHIRAVRQGDQVVLEVRDDGGGVDIQRVMQVARDRGVVTEEQLRTMTEANIVDLIFAPGFSTVTTLTELSGRGVGMDAVRQTVERAGGRVWVESRLGFGTTIRLSLPFSVMMTRVMTVEAGEQIFGIPLDAVVETVRVPKNSVAGVGNAQVIVMRNQTIPLLELAKTLGLECASASGAEATIVITTSAGQVAGIQVDRLGEQMDVILQPLEGLLSGTPGITGTTLLGDGRVLLVLDIGELLK